MSRRAMTGGRCGDLGAQEALSLLPALAAAAARHLLRSHSAYSALPAPDLAPAITIAHWIWIQSSVTSISSGFWYFMSSIDDWVDCFLN